MAGRLPLPALRARRTAAVVRASLALSGLAITLVDGSAGGHPILASVGFSIILIAAGIQALMPRQASLVIDEWLEPVATVLVVGVGDQRVTALSVLWLAAVGAGVMARGG